MTETTFAWPTPCASGASRPPAPESIYGAARLTFLAFCKARPKNDRICRLAIAPPFTPGMPSRVAQRHERAAADEISASPMTPRRHRAELGSAV